MIYAMSLKGIVALHFTNFSNIFLNLAGITLVELQSEQHLPLTTGWAL
jgi:hypothetical protein